MAGSFDIAVFLSFFLPAPNGVRHYWYNGVFGGPPMGSGTIVRRNFNGAYSRGLTPSPMINIYYDRIVQ